MRFAIGVIFILTALLSQSLMANDLTKHDSIKYKVSRYFTEQGLIQNSADAMLIDSDGFLWIGTLDGLNRFDGVSFIDYGIKHSQSDVEVLLKRITYLFEDSQHNIWIGTQSNGVFILDRTTHIIRPVIDITFKNKPLTIHIVNGIVEDAEGNMWIGTDNGLLHYQLATGHVITYQHDPHNPDSLQSSKINHLLIDSAKRLWVATDEGLHRYLPIKDSFEHYLVTTMQTLGDIFQQSVQGQVHHIFEDSHDRFWVSSGVGQLYQFNPTTGQFKLFATESINYDIVSIKEDLAGKLWLGYKGGGILQIDATTGKSVYLHHDIRNAEGLSSNSIRIIEVDLQGIIWVGTNNGLNKVNPSLLQFGHVTYSPIIDSSLRLLSVNSLEVDQLGRLWVGSLNDGINIQNQHHGSTRQLFSEFQSLHELIQSGDKQKPRTLRDIIAIGERHVWLATEMGLRRFDIFTGEMTSFVEDELNITHPDEHKAVALLDFDEQHLWIGTVRGLKRLDKHTGQFDHHQLLNYSSSGVLGQKGAQDGKAMVDLSTISIRDMVRLGDWVYIGTNSVGLVAYHVNTGQIKQYTRENTGVLGLTSDVIISLLVDKNNNLWIGTYTGLHKFDPMSEQFTVYNTDNGLVNNTIYTMLEDNAGYLWFSSNQGLTRFDPIREISTDFSVDDGVQSNEFNRRTAFKSARGELIFGGVNGFNRFHPDNLSFVEQRSKVMLTGIEINNQDYAQLNPDWRNVNALSRIDLSYEQRLFSIDFVLLDFVNPSKHRFEYQLTGFDERWLQTSGGFRRVSYTNLPAGEYLFKVRAKNQRGVASSNTKTLVVSIAPAPWATWWAYAVYCVLAMLMLLFLYRLEHQKVLQALRINKEYEKVDQLKDEFLANTSHELRTPLHGIIGLTESMLSGAHGPLTNELKEELMIVVQSGRRLGNLVNDILDFSKIRNAQLELNLQALNLHAVAEVVVVMLRTTIGDKPLQLINDIDVDCVSVRADEKRLQQILFNLVGNALKYTDKGTVRIVAKQNDQQVVLSVIDTGLGISKDDLSRIFMPFEQLDGGTARAQGGTGIGLSLTKQLVEMHGGCLDVKSVPNEGSEFYFGLVIASASDYQSTEPLGPCEVEKQMLETQSAIATIKDINNDGLRPIGDSFLFKNRFLKGKQPQNKQAQGRWLEDELLESEQLESEQLEDELSEGKLANKAQFKLLLVDDDQINLRVLHNYLSVEQYQLKQATNGGQALALIKEESFDLVLLDIMMPRVSGFEVCAQLRKQFDVNDLPVIFITAKNQLADFEHSFSVGANDYLTKPVIKQELLARVKTHLRLLDINRNLEDKVSERTKMLDGANKNMQVLSEIAQQISAILDLDLLLQKVHELVTPLFSNDSFLIALFDEKKQVLDFGYYCEQGERIENIYVCVDETDRPAVQCFKSSKAIIVDDYQAELSQCKIASLEPIWGVLSQSFMYYPLIVSGKTIGVISIQSLRPHAYSVNQQQMFQTLASSVAVAIDNASAYHQIDEQNKEIVDAQQKLVQAEKMASLGTLSAGMAHEINNPTNFIYVSSQNLSADLTAFEDFIVQLASDDADEEILATLKHKFSPLYQHATTILEGATRIKTIVYELKLFAQLDANERKMVELSEHLHTVVNLIRNQYESVVKFELNCQPGVKLLCYPAQLNQVFMNIIVNACEAIERKQKQAQEKAREPEQNQERISTRGTVIIESVYEQENIHVTISDNGTGMSADIADKIFEPFFTTKAVGEGVGLGLSIAYGIVDKHGGVIEVTTGQPHGASFVVNLNAKPLSKSEPKSKSDNQTDDESNG